MSNLTEMVLHTMLRDDVETFNAALKDIVGDPRMLFQELDKAGLKCQKLFCNGVYATCWNHNKEKITLLVQLFAEFPWKNPEDAILLICDENESFTKIFRPQNYYA